MTTAFSPARPGIADRLSRMIGVPTIAGDDAAFSEYARLLEELFPLVHERLEVERVGPDARGHLFHWAGAGGDRPVVLMAHTDVVPVDASAGWDEQPFAGVVRDGRVFGRGTLDDKGPQIVVLEAVENLLAAGWTPPSDVYLFFGSNEETYGGDAEHVSALLQERGVLPWLVLDEGGAVVDAPLSFVPVKAAMVGVAEKGIMTVRLTVRSTGGHASAPPRPTTAGRLARAIARVESGAFADRMPQATRSMFAAFAPHVSLRHRVVLRTLRTAHGVAARALAAQGGEPAALMQTTVVTTMLGGGEAANVLPAALTATINIRIAQGETVASVVDTLRKRIRDDSIAIEVLEGTDPSPVSAIDNEQFALIRAGVDATYPGTVTAPYIMMAATDARHLHRFAPAVYRFSPLAMTKEQRAGIHGANENVEIDSLERGERFFQHLLLSL